MLSFILVTYNSERFIGQALESVFKEVEEADIEYSKAIWRAFSYNY